MSKASPKIFIKQSIDASGVTRVVMEQSAIGMRNEEQFVLDWSDTTSSKGPIGEVKRTSNDTAATALQWDNVVLSSRFINP